MSRRSGSNILKALAIGTVRGIVLYLVVTAVALGLLVALILCGALAAFLFDVDGGVIFVGVLLAWFLLVAGGGGAVAAAMLILRARALNAAFVPLGLQGRMYMQNGRQYHGTVGGRKVDVYFYRGPTLEIFVETPLRTRMGVGTRDSLTTALGGLMDRHPLPLGYPDMDHLHVYALDEDWARRLLADPSARTALQRLTGGPEGYATRQVIVAPESIMLRLAHVPQTAIAAESARQWLDDLLLLAGAAEALPAPVHTAEATGLERRSRTRRGDFYRYAIIATLAFFAVMICFSILLTVILVWLNP